MEEVLDNLAFFRSEILSVYIGRPDKYIVEFGLYGGHIKSLQGTPQENVIDLRFAFRELPDGELAIAAFKPDLENNTAESERSKWSGFELSPSDFREHIDPNFKEWVSVYLMGNWAKETPPLQQVVDQIKSVNAISAVVAGCDVFSVDCDTFSAYHNELLSLRFPFANNTHAYEDAHRELYRYINDAICIECVNKLGKLLKIKPTTSKKGFKALRAVFQGAHDLLDSLGEISRHRGKSVHKVRPSAVRYEAYKHFVTDLERLARGVENLVCILESEFDISRKKALALVGLPKYSKEATENQEINSLSTYLYQEITGFGVYVVKGKGEVTRDALYITFKNGSQVAISFSADMTVFIDNETPKPSDLIVGFDILESEELDRASIEYDEELMELLILQEAIQKLSGRKLVGFRLCDVEDESEYLPQRQLLFLDLDDGSSLAIEPALILDPKVNSGVIDSSSQTMATEDIHLQMVLHDVPA